MSELLKPPRIFVFFLLVSYASLSAVILTPALPFLSQDFGISETMAQWTMSVFLIGYALGQLPYSPLANRFGRKKTVYIGIVVSLIGIFLSLFAHSIGQLCLGRFIQALGSAVGLKIAFTMIGDQHSGVSATKAVSHVMLAFGAVPGISIAIGGVLITYWSWQSCFVFLAFYSLLLALLCLILPETATHLDKDALRLPKIAHGYFTQFKDSFTMLHALLMGFITAIIYLFATLSPYIGIEFIGLSPEQFGFWSIVPSIGLAVGLYSAGRMAGKTSPRIAMISGILLILVGTLVMGLSFASGWIHVLSLFGTMFAIQIGDGVALTFASSKALSEAHDKSHASAVLQFINLSISTLAVFILSEFPPQPFLLPISFFILSLLLVFTWLKLREHHLKRP